MPVPIRRRTARAAAAVTLLTAPAATAPAADIGAKANGNWTSGATWTSNSVPTTADRVFIGSTTPGGSASSATVTLTQNQAAGSVFVGHTSGASGTLALGTFKLSAANLTVGQAGSFTITRGAGGALAITDTLTVGTGKTFGFAAADTAATLASAGGTVTTAATGNVTAGVNLTAAAKLTLGANLSVSGTVTIDGTNSRLDAATKNITANILYLDANGGAASLINRGKLTITDTLDVRGQNFNVTAGTDTVSTFSLSNGTTVVPAGANLDNLGLSAAATGTLNGTDSVLGTVSVAGGSKLTLAAPLNIAGNLDISNAGSQVIAGGNAITAAGLSLNNGGTLTGAGKLSVDALTVNNQTFQIAAADKVTTFSLNGGSTALPTGAAVGTLVLDSAATATTASANAITAGLTVAGGSTLTLGGNVTLTGGVSVNGAGSKINAGGFAISAASVTLTSADGAANLTNRGKLTVTGGLSVRNQPFGLATGDSAGIFTLQQGTGTMAAGSSVGQLFVVGAGASPATVTVAGTVSARIEASNNGTVTLAAPQTLTDGLYVNGTGSKLDLGGQALTAAKVHLSQTGTAAVTFQNDGKLTVAEWKQANGTAATLTGGNDTLTTLALASGATMLVKSGQATGLTIAGGPSLSVDLAAGTKVTFELDGNHPGWVFRWLNPQTGGNHEGDINNLVGTSRFAFTVSNGATFNVADGGDGYTYIFQPVPEPGSVLAVGAGAFAVAGLARRRLRVVWRRPG